MIDCYKIPFKETDNLEDSFLLVKKQIFSSSIDSNKRPKIVFYGIGNSKICKKLVSMAANKVFDLSVNTSIFNFPKHSYLEEIEQIASKNKVTIVITTSFEEAIKNADLIYVEKNEDLEKIKRDFDFMARRETINAEEN